MPAMPIRLQDANGVDVAYPAAAPVALADPQGNACESALIASSTVAALNDVLFDIPTKGVGSVIFDFVSGSGWGLVAESTINGSDWKAVPFYVLSRNVDTPVYTGATVNAQRWCAAPNGGLRLRLRVSTVGTGTLAGVARSSVLVIDSPFLRPKANPYRLSSSSVAAGLLIRSPASLLMGYHLQNTNAAARYVQLYSKSSAPVVGTDVPAYTIPLAASSIDRSPISEMAFSGGLGLAVTTDFAGSTAAANGDVLGTIMWSV